MAILKVVEYPNPILDKHCAPVKEVNAEIQAFISDMFDAMYNDNGCGLAANQVGHDKQIIIMDPTRNKSRQICLINPNIIDKRGEVEMDEGCLSFPGLYIPIKRAAEVTVQGLDREGNPIELEADGLLARIILHEYDHIIGVSYINYLSALKRKRALRKLEKLHRLN